MRLKEYIFVLITINTSEEPICTTIEGVPTLALNLNFSVIMLTRRSETNTVKTRALGGRATYAGVAALKLIKKTHDTALSRWSEICTYAKRVTYVRVTNLKINNKKKSLDMSETENLKIPLFCVCVCLARVIGRSGRRNRNRNRAERSKRVSIKLFGYTRWNEVATGTKLLYRNKNVHSYVVHKHTA